MRSRGSRMCSTRRPRREAAAAAAEAARSTRRRGTSSPRAGLRHRSRGGMTVLPSATSASREAGERESVRRSDARRVRRGLVERRPRAPAGSGRGSACAEHREAFCRGSRPRGRLADDADLPQDQVGAASIGRRSRGTSSPRSSDRRCARVDPEVRVEAVLGGDSRSIRPGNSSARALGRPRATASRRRPDGRRRRRRRASAADGLEHRLDHRLVGGPPLRSLDVAAVQGARVRVQALEPRAPAGLRAEVEDVIGLEERSRDSGVSC